MSDRTGGQPSNAILSADEAAQMDRLIELRRRLHEEKSSAMSPAVARALEMADYQLFLGLTYFGFTERLFPEEE